MSEEGFSLVTFLSSFLHPYVYLPAAALVGYSAIRTQRIMSRRKSEKLSNGDVEVAENHTEEEVDQNDDQSDDKPRASKRAKKEAKKDKKEAKKSPRKRSASKSLKEEDEESDTEYEVAKIVDVKTVKGKRQFLVNWKGYASKDNSWEPEDHLSCQDLIDEFFKDNKNKSPEKPKKATKTASKSPKGKKKKTK
nr:PREDICTED: chromobox protein homolog 1-like [Bemisia tabaci]